MTQKPPSPGGEEEDTRLRHGVYKAFARESAVEQGLDPSVWPFVPLSKEAATEMINASTSANSLAISAAASVDRGTKGQTLGSSPCSTALSRAKAS